MSSLLSPRIAALAVLAIAPFSLPAAAAPAAPPAPAVAGAPLAEPIACWWRNGVRRCNGYSARRYGYRYGPSYGYRPSYGYSYGTPRPEDLRFGSTEWWRAMDREGRGGYRR